MLATCVKAHAAGASPHAAGAKPIRILSKANRLMASKGTGVISAMQLQVCVVASQSRNGVGGKWLTSCMMGGAIPDQTISMQCVASSQP